MSEEWQWARGTALIEGGIDLLDLSADQLYSAAYALLMKRLALGKEINEGFDEVKASIRRSLREQETGMPSVAAMGFLPLNLDEFMDEGDIPAELLGGDR